MSWAEDKAAASTPEAKPGDLSAIGAKLANPLSDLWSITTSWNMPAYYDGNVNTGNPKMGASTILEPVLPIPIYGSGADEWRMVTRPVIPLIWSQPVPTGFNEFDHKSGIGDIQLPLLMNLPESISGHWLMGAGPVWLFPTATNDDLGEDQWGVGPAAVLGYKTEKATFGVFPNYFWKIGSSGQDSLTPDVNKGNMLYFFNYMLGDAWQVGTNPTITYNHQASSGDKWEVPVGLYVGKTIRVGKMPLNIKVGGEYLFGGQLGRLWAVLLVQDPDYPGDSGPDPECDLRQIVNDADGPRGGKSHENWQSASQAVY